MKKIDVTEQMLTAAKSTFICYMGIEAAKAPENALKLLQLEYALFSIFGTEEPSEDWKESYKKQQDEYAREGFDDIADRVHAESSSED